MVTEMDIPCFILVAFDADKAWYLRSEMKAMEIGSEEWSRLAEELNKLNRITLKGATPSAAEKELQQIVAREDNWQGRKLEVRVLRETAKNPKDLWIADVSVEVEDEDGDTARVLRAIGRGDSESKAREEMLFILRDLGWLGSIREEDLYVRHPESYMHCGACSGDDAIKPTGAYGPTYSEALANARKLVESLPEWKLVNPTYVFSNVDNGTGPWEVAVKVKLFGEQVLVTSQGRTREHAEHMALGALNNLGWKKGLKAEDVLHYDSHNNATGERTLGGGTAEPEKLVEKGGALMLESRTTESDERAKKTETLQKVATGALPVGFLIYASLTLLDIFGIVHSFAQHSNTMGWLALLIPPFGAIMGIEAMIH